MNKNNVKNDIDEDSKRATICIWRQRHSVVSVGNIKCDKPGLEFPTRNSEWICPR